MRLFVMIALLFYLSVSAAEIYKTVDENGNIIYTDRKPAPNAAPIDLPELNVADPHRPIPRSPERVESDESWQGFRITSPAAGENIWGSGGDLTVAVSSPGELRRDMGVTIYLDGQAYDAGRSLSYTIEALERGEHRLSAELYARGGRVLAATDEMVFYMKQFSTNAPRRRNNNSGNSGGNNSGNNGGGNNRNGGGNR